MTGQTQLLEPLAYSVPDACAALGIGMTQLYKEIGAGRLTVCKVGKRTLIERSEALRWLASLRVAAVSAVH
ncbi:helix-turn-helix domain-containing protein [Sphingomonas alba]|uniref:Helix-turn-helix domain-containing protein n=1 Tax=Sphingomonas alba TaxID=2908208 RepID=A0ABT0RP70_9SPHN|nr:helix-turn-helix domain-containing protein [Sphingomonas alba]MCL6684452.1 helix-turn-helix domain-containing protein [Sphingomonas alba]